jgi:hypothetical protein
LLKMPPALKTKPVMTSEETLNITSQFTNTRRES